MPKKSKANRHPFAIYYTDGSYMVYDVTMEDYEDLKRALTFKEDVVETTVGLIMTRDIRSVIEQRPPEKPKEATPDKPALPKLTIEEARWIKTAMEGIYDVELDEEVVN